MFPFPSPNMRPEHIAMEPNGNFWLHCHQMNAYMDFYGKCVESEYLTNTHLRAFTMVRTLPAVGCLGEAKGVFMKAYANHDQKLLENHKFQGGSRYPLDLTYEHVWGRLDHLVAYWEARNAGPSGPAAERGEESREIGVGNGAVGQGEPRPERIGEGGWLTEISDEEEEADEEEEPCRVSEEIEESEEVRSEGDNDSAEISEDASRGSDISDSGDDVIITGEQFGPANQGERRG